MQIVINISDKLYKSILNMEVGICRNTLIKAITFGTPLPKGHGRLIDEDMVLRNAKSTQTVVDVNNVPTIIEADKEE